MRYVILLLALALTACGGGNTSTDEELKEGDSIMYYNGVKMIVHAPCMCSTNSPN